jgi:hypothetical protein
VRWNIAAARTILGYGAVRSNKYAFAVDLTASTILRPGRRDLSSEEYSMSEEAARKLSESGRCSVSLRVRHPSCDPNEITGELGLAPEHSWACGEPRRSDAGMPLGGVRHDSYWMATLPGVSLAQWQTTESHPKITPSTTDELPGAMAQLQMQLQMMAQIRRNRPFFERLIAEGAEVTFVVEFEAAAGMSFRLDPAPMRQLGELGLRLEFDFV